MEATVKLWTVQRLEAYEYLLKHKVLTTTNQYIDPDFKPAYDWLRTKMNQILATQHTDIYPLWAWYQYRSALRRKPELSDEALLPAGTKGVRMLIIKPVSEVVFSDFLLWHYVLNNWFINTYTPEDIEFEKMLDTYKSFDYPDDVQARITKSWDKIFDLNHKDKYYKAPKFKKIIQATFWQLRLDEVRKVDFFVAK